MSESSGHSYLQSHDIGGEVLRLNLTDESTAVLEAAGNAGVRHAAKTLVKEGPLRVVLLGMKAGSKVGEHEAGGPVSIHLLSGSVSVSGGGREEALDTGNALVFPSTASHSLEAAADSVVLVTVAWAAR
jgi:quercetin dioxygenase-like cupin family protein